MNELTPLPQLVGEIKIYLRQTADGIFEAGKRLNLAKEQVPHGEWEGFLQEHFKLKERTAQNMMRVASEIPKTQTFADLPVSKIYALLDVPAAERETFIATPHEVNGQQKTVDEMTTRELAEAIKARKEAEKNAADIAAALAKTTTESQRFQKQLDDVKAENLRLADMKKPETITKEVAKEVSPPDYEATKQKLKEATARIDKMTDEQLGQAQAIFQQGKRAEIRSRLSMLAKDVGKHVKELELLVRILPGDESVSSDLTEIANILRDTADAVEQMEAGVTIDAGLDSNVWPG